MIAKGYYTPLQGQAELAQAYQQLRPFVRDWVTWGEDFAVFPVYLSLRGPAYDPALRTEVPPETWEDWLQELLTRVENDRMGSSRSLKDGIPGLTCAACWWRRCWSSIGLPVEPTA